jgi:predicted PurR-regulated permease PerM
MQTNQLSPLKIFSWLAMAIGCCLLIWWLRAVLMPFILAAAIAYLLLPAVLYLSGAKAFPNGWVIRLPRALAALLMEVFFFVVISLLVLLISPVITNEWPHLRAKLPSLMQQMAQLLTPYLQGLGLPAQIDRDSIESFLKQYFDVLSQADLLSLLSSVKIGGSIALTVIGDAVLVPVVLFYLLLEGEVFYHHCIAWVPLPLKDSLESFLHECDLMLDQYLRGQVSVMLILAVYYTSALSLFGCELAFPIGVFTGLVIFVPYLGFGMGLSMALLSCILQFGLLQALFTVGVVYGVGQLIEGFILTPMLVGKRIGLHPLGLIFALLAFGQTLGFVGVLIALPISSICLVALRRIKASYFSSDVYTG